MDEWEFAHSGTGGGMALLAFVLIVLIVVLAVAWMTAPEPPRAPPKPIAPPPPPPGKAPALPGGPSGQIRTELATLSRQIGIYAEGNVEPILAPATARILEMVRTYEALVEAHHEKCRRMIEK
jgi:hypothetical protein